MKNTILAFHIGKGGHFNNGGHLTFRGQYTIEEIMNLRAESRWHFYQDRDNKGRFTSPHYVDHNGNYLISEKEVQSGIGKLEWDYTYDTDYTTYAKDLNDQEAHLVLEEAMRFEGQYCWNYPLDEMIEGISTKVITKAASSGKLIEVYDWQYKGEAWILDNILEEEIGQEM
jgi:hypothetical protein